MTQSSSTSSRASLPPIASSSKRSLPSPPIPVGDPSKRSTKLNKKTSTTNLFSRLRGISLSTSPTLAPSFTPHAKPTPASNVFGVAPRLTYAGESAVPLSPTHIRTTPIFPSKPRHETRRAAMSESSTRGSCWSSYGYSQDGCYSPTSSQPATPAFMPGPFLGRSPTWMASPSPSSSSRRVKRKPVPKMLCIDVGKSIGDLRYQFGTVDDSDDAELPPDDPRNHVECLLEFTNPFAPSPSPFLSPSIAYDISPTRLTFDLPEFPVTPPSEDGWDSDFTEGGFLPSSSFSSQSSVDLYSDECSSLRKSFVLPQVYNNEPILIPLPTLIPSMSPTLSIASTVTGSDETFKSLPPSPLPSLLGTSGLINDSKRPSLVSILSAISIKQATRVQCNDQAVWIKPRLNVVGALPERNAKYFAPNCPLEYAGDDEVIDIVL